MDAAAEAGVARRRERYEQARAWPANGACVAHSAREVGMARLTVSKDLRDGPPQRKRHRIHGKPRVLEPWEPYLLQRWAEGGHTATVLRRALQTQEFAPSVSNVQRFVAHLRRDGPPPIGRSRSALTEPHGPPPRPVAAIVLRPPGRRSDEQRADLTRLRAEDAAIAVAAELAEASLVMLRRREGERRPTWLAVAETSGIDDLKRFAGKLRTDLATVRAGLTVRQSNGQTEGQVTRLKSLKRQMFGRATFPLLRHRFLLTA